jgi:ABC-type polysaccharide/polyol phosphate transport system ATPase subunit
MDQSNVIMVSHDAPTMRAWCDKGAVLADGHIEMFDDVESAIQAHERRMQDASSSREQQE